MGDASDNKPEQTQTTPIPQQSASEAPKAGSSRAFTEIAGDTLKTHLNNFIKEPTKHILLMTFALYSTGFLIWHFYLSTFGIAAVGFLQVEYISAAFCFLFIFFGLSVPPYLFFTIFGKTALSSGGLFNIHQWNDKTYAYTLTIWYFLNDRLIKVFLPSSQLSKNGSTITMCLFLLLILHVCFGIYLATKAGDFKRLANGNNAILSEDNINFKKSKLFKYGSPSTYIPLYFGLLTFVNLFCNSEIDKSFLFITILFWFGASTEPGVDLKEFWPKSGFLLRSMLCIGIFLSFLTYVRIFSVNQFGKIPKSVGGGKPEIVYLALSKQNVEFAKSMNLREVKTPHSTNSLFGPVGILLKNDGDYTFLDYSDAIDSPYFTNSFHFTFITNVAKITLTQSNSELKYSIMTNLVCDTSLNAFYNTNGLAARQIRADLIDGVIYNK
jgi:hypothetical protein